MPPILITRPRDAAVRLAEDLRSVLGNDVDLLIAPLIEIEHQGTLPDLTPFGTVIFTSSYAVARFCALTDRRDFRCYTVGEATGSAAREQSFNPIVGPGTAKQLTELITQQAPPTPCLYLRGAHVAFDMADALNGAGFETHSAVIYRQSEVPMNDGCLSRVKSEPAVIAPVFSPRSAELLCKAVSDLSNFYIAAISPQVAESFAKHTVAQLAIAAKPDKAAMLATVAMLWHDAQSA